jgi:beta-glucanase (GH16 family)
VKLRRALRWVLLVSLGAALMSSPAIGGAAMLDTTGWKLTWSDEFEGAGGLNAADWLYDTGTGYVGGPPNWGTGEIESYTSSLENVYLEGGYLHIRALHSGSEPLAGWTSGRIETQRADFQPPVGGALAVEARLQLPTLSASASQGYWPAFWMLGAPYRGNYWNWPGIGEIDILENINGLNQWWGALHCGSNPGGPCNEPAGLGGNFAGFAPSLQEAFHTYRMEFDKSVTPQQLRWSVDGVQRLLISSDQVGAQAWEAATEHGFFILLNVAIGGGWAGNPTGATAAGGTMVVDSVRVYTWWPNAVFLPMMR